jgi:hypothetical protein
VLRIVSALATVAFALAALVFVWSVEAAIGMALNPTAAVAMRSPWMLPVLPGLVAGVLYWLMRLAWAAVDRRKTEPSDPDEPERESTS